MRGPSSRTGCAFATTPKLVVAVPFTPVTGPRVLVRDESQRERMVLALAEGVRRFVDAESISGAHVLFLPRAETAAFENGGFVQRWGIQYQWHNPGYADFEEFLGTFSSKKRNQIRRERRELDRQGLGITTLRGAEITEEVVDASYEFYLLTVDKFRWGRRYLNRAFFGEICERMGATSKSSWRANRGGASSPAPSICRRTRALWSLLGRHRRAPLLALQRLLLPQHRAVHRTQDLSFRAGCGRRTQARARFHADAHL